MGDIVMTTGRDVVEFWRNAGPERWFGGGDDFDAQCRTHFLDAHLRAARREFEHWLDEAEGALALVLLLDQIPRNVFRRSGHAYATDGLARHYAARALAIGLDTQVDPDLRNFFYLPFQHSEAMADQERALELFARLDAGADRWARHHHEIIRRFGRFPHRNAALGRESTSEERAFLPKAAFPGRKRCVLQEIPFALSPSAALLRSYAQNRLRPQAAVEGDAATKSSGPPTSLRYASFDFGPAALRSGRTAVEVAES